MATFVKFFYVALIMILEESESIWKFFLPEFSEMEGEAPKINLKLNNRDDKLYLTLNTTSVEVISYTYRF